MMNKIKVTVAVLLGLCQHGMAQDSKSNDTESAYQYDNLVQLWRNTGNSAGIGIDSTRNRGVAEFSFAHREGSYHRVQEGASMNDFSFFTERYQNIGKHLYGYGSFNFNTGSTHDRAWSDVMRTYESNPFIAGSSVAGRYDHQNFGLKAQVGTTDLGALRLGMGVEYGVGDLSRLRDPRSRSRLLDYKVQPAVTYTTGNSTLGISGFYDRRKEKMPTLTTVQNTPNLYYYQMSGLDAVSGTVGGYSGFQREYVMHAFGAELQYGYRTQYVSSLNAINIEQQEEYIYEQYKREPGKYFAYNYGLKSQNRIIRSNVTHQIDAEVKWQQAYADEYRPELIIEIDSLKGYNSYHYVNELTYNKRYQMEKVEGSVRYRANLLKGKTINSYFGIAGQYGSLSQKHLLPSSTFNLQQLSFFAEYGQAILKNQRLWIEATLGYMAVMKADMNLADESSDYAREVLLHDMNYYDANCMRGCLSIKYHFPVKFKNMKNMCYVKAFAKTVQAQHSLNANTFGITLGFFN